MPQKQLFRQFKQDFVNLQRAPDLTLTVSAVVAWCLLGQIQLACRHPENHGPSRDVAEQFARDIQARIATTPALRRVAETGWNPQYDQEAEP